MRSSGGGRVREGLVRLSPNRRHLVGVSVQRLDNVESTYAITASLSNLSQSASPATHYRVRRYVGLGTRHVSYMFYLPETGRVMIVVMNTMKRMEKSNNDHVSLVKSELIWPSMEFRDGFFEEFSPPNRTGVDSESMQ
jgi:hypothetical protein